MAITIRQEPTTPNMANSDLVYVVTSTQVNQAQFQYVLDIKDENDNLIQRIKQQPNPSSKGVFNIGTILPTQLGPTDTIWDITAANANVSCGKDFKIYFGEEYGTSPSSSVTLYDGAGSSGDPNVSGSAYYFNLDGFVNESAELNWNWASGSKYDEEDATDDITFTYQNGLTYFDTSSIREGDYHSISLINGKANGTENATLAQDVIAMKVKEYDSSDSLLATTTYYNEVLRGGSPTVVFWGSIYNLQTDNTRLIHWPAGPQNFDDAGNTLNASTSYYIVSFHPQATDGLPNDNGIWGEYRFDLTDKNCGYDGVRFAWKNSYGVWDYYTFSLAESRTAQVEKNEYQQSFINYSTTGNTVTYDRERRGRTQYYNKVNKLRTAESDYLTQEDADNLRELFFSTNVYVQQATGEYWPVVITNATVTEKTNPKTQKLFRFTAEYEYANGQRPRL